MSDARPGLGIVEELVVDLLFVGATDAKRNRARHVPDDCANAVLDRVKRRIETDGHVPAANVEANAGNADLFLVGNDATDRLRVTEMAIGADHAGDDVADRHAIAHLRNRRVVVLAEHLERAVLELGGLRLIGCDRIRGVSGLPRQMLFARGITERAPDRHRPLAWPLDSAVGVEACFASHFPRTLLVWIGSVHSLALGYCRLPTQPCVCFRKLKESFIVKKFGGCGRSALGTGSSS